LNIKYIIDTSYHNDLRLGYLELKEKLNCEVYIGPQDEDDDRAGLK
jgi:glyoxylase-like metal-dependent hydrolase (beta-lactamase superfamily II)